jgi:hypothetical protein
VVTQAKSSPIRIQGSEQLDSSPIRDLGGHPSRIIPDSRLGWSPKPNHPRFETWVVTQAKLSPTYSDSRIRTVGISPIRDLGGHPSRIIPDSRLGWSPKPNHPRFETWVVTQAELSPTYSDWVVTSCRIIPIRDLGGHPSRIIPDSRLGWSPKPNYPQHFGFKDPKQLESPIRDLGGHPSRIIPDLRLGWSPKPNYPQHIRIQGSEQLESSPIRDLGGHPSRIIPDSRLGWSPKPNHPRFETWVVTQAKSSPISRLGWSTQGSEQLDSPIRDLGGHPSRIIPDLRLGWSPKPNHPQHILGFPRI